MNDRELLELAARAAGFTGYGFFLGDDGIDVSDENWYSLRLEPAHRRRRRAEAGSSA
ncbi:Uncharacterised protein [Pseudomonas aeruginosa]|nr:Uncharacterised protein [Pseudomonas aeruginosa]